MSRTICRGLFVSFLAAVLTATPTVQAQTTWYVDDDAPNDPCPGDPNCGDPLEDGSADHPFDAIQEGINAAVDGDTVLVLDGTYTGTGNRDLDFGSKAITVRGASGDLPSCVIDCEGDLYDPHRGFYFHNGEGPDSIVEELTITAGVVECRGGAIRCEGGASPAILNCVITGNVAGYRGGGIYCDNASSPVLINCTIRGNSVEYRGAGISCDHGSSPLMLNCVITGNVADYRGAGIYCDHNSNPKLVNCVVSGNTAATRGSGISCDHASNVTIINSTVSANTGGGDGIFLDHESSPTITNSVIWGNTSLEIRVFSGDPVITFSDIGGGWPGEGNIDADPLFVDPDGPDNDPNTWEDNDYRLASGSPCVDAGDNEAVPPDITDLDDDGDTAEPTPLDLDGNPRFVDDPATPDTGNGEAPIVDMGAYEFQVVPVHLDIKPGSCPNPLNVQSHGVLPAAIVGTAEFDVTQIGVDTLVLTRADGVGGGVTPLMGPPGPGIHVDDVATPFDGEPCECHEYEGDGIDDLTMKFDTELVVAELQLTDLPGGTSVELVISGQLLDGTQFGGTDCITIRPLGPQPGAALGTVNQDARTPQTASETTSTERQETEQEAFATPSAACGFLSPAFLPVAIAGMSVVRHRRRRAERFSTKRRIGQRSAGTALEPAIVEKRFSILPCQNTKEQGRPIGRP